MDKFKIAFDELILEFPVPALHGMAMHQLKLAEACAQNGDRKCHYILAAKLLDYLAEVEEDMDDYSVNVG